MLFDSLLQTKETGLRGCPTRSPLLDDHIYLNKENGEAHPVWDVSSVGVNGGWVDAWEWEDMRENVLLSLCVPVGRV